jgi:PAS domain S-box-containing protein
VRKSRKVQYLTKPVESAEARAQIMALLRIRRGEEALARLAAIVESSEDAVIGKTLDGKITSWNAGAERLFGFTAKEALGQLISILAPPDRPDEMPAILERIRRGDRVESFETVRLRKDGALVEVSLSVSPVRAAAGRIVGAAQGLYKSCERGTQSIISAFLASCGCETARHYDHFPSVKWW